MNVLLPAISLSRTSTGVSRHAVNLARSLATSREVDCITLVAGEWQREFLEEMLHDTSGRIRLHVDSDVRNSSLSRNLWHLRSLPSVAAQLRADIVHLTYPMPLRRSSFGCPVVVSVHDLYPHDVPSNFGYPRVFVNQIVLHVCLTAADVLACVSESTLDRLIALRPEVAARSLHLPNAVEASCYSNIAPVPGLKGHRFILAVAQHRYNKNLPLTLRAFARMVEITRDADTLLLIIGETGPETPRLKQLLQDLALESRVVMSSGISEAQLRWCYQRSDLLLATSSIEGFGLPVAEALLAGCPVVCSDIAAFRELNPGTLILVDLEDLPVEHFACAMRAIRSRHRCKPQPLPHLSTTSVGIACLDLYQELLLPQSQYSVRTPRLFAEKTERRECS